MAIAPVFYLDWLSPSLISSWFLQLLDRSTVIAPLALSQLDIENFGLALAIESSKSDLTGGLISSTLLQEGILKVLMTSDEANDKF
jgi:hypothetical protein